MQEFQPEGNHGSRASLADVLASRDARAEAQARLMDRWGVPLVSLTMVTPGSVKNSPRLGAALDAGARAVESAVAEAGNAVRARERLESVAGGTALLAVDCEALSLKAIALDVEDRLPWGRLLDIDVLAPEGAPPRPVPVRRENLGRSPRTCLVCGEPAFECMRARRHAAEELAAAVEALLRGVPMEGRLKPAQAGTLESCDIMIALAPAEPGTGIDISLDSPAKKQYGRRIREVLEETLAAAGLTDVTVHANDRGALDCTIRARLEAAIARARAADTASATGASEGGRP